MIPKCLCCFCLPPPPPHVGVMWVWAISGSLIMLNPFYWEEGGKVTSGLACGRFPSFCIDLSFH